MLNLMFSNPSGGVSARVRGAGIEQAATDGDREHECRRDRTRFP
jgi:hypothetical protein